MITKNIYYYPPLEIYGIDPKHLNVSRGGQFKVQMKIEEVLRKALSGIYIP